jgi:hypothetical protein
MACGTPVVATAVGGVPEIVTSTDAGAMVEERSAPALVRAVRELLAPAARARRDAPLCRAVRLGRHLEGAAPAFQAGPRRELSTARHADGARRLRSLAMCGIFGVLNLDGSPAERAALQAMARVSVHRGPDDEGFHLDGACGIGMRRLSIIDLAGGHQPLANRDGSLVVVCNGEIYNFRELRRELETLGQRFATGSDSEVILHGYAQWGDQVVERLNGMFGFALWDARRARLVIGRDRLGIKPVYLYRDARRLAFASEAKALLALPGVQTAIEPSALHGYLSLGYVPAPASLFKGITKLAPATLLAIERGRIEQTRYWRIPHTIEREVPKANGSSACAPVSTRRCACRW